ncbi:hypothetical protein SAMN05444414_12529 [Roseovarius marisflavi]|uniref:Uncharacterized protein n=1 Tax=Roseovarius marisflavi TaxID=1054996 RepID=A0A1M7CI04_9RHOB|nr:hypothetical protein SAMN05444414_12529 [Roseovarius marisflavi]
MILHETEACMPFKMCQSCAVSAPRRIIGHCIRPCHPPALRQQARAARVAYELSRKSGIGLWICTFENREAPCRGGEAFDTGDM